MTKRKPAIPKYVLETFKFHIDNHRAIAEMYHFCGNNLDGMYHWTCAKQYEDLLKSIKEFKKISEIPDK